VLRMILTPLIEALRFLYLTLFQITGNHGWSLIGLSLVITIFVTILSRLLSTYEKRDKQIQSILEPQIKAINGKYKGQDRHIRIKALYRRYSYYPLLALRSSIPLFLQLPFLLSAYYMIGALGIIEGKPLWGIPDLSKPDSLLGGLNLLPFIMTVVNLLTVFISLEFRLKDKLQGSLLAGVFLVLLYNSPSALLIYWTMNNLFSCIRTIVRRILTRKRLETKGARNNRAGMVLRLPKQEFLQHYFGILVLFYFVQAIAVHPWEDFCGVFKYIPFALASYLFWLLQVRELFKNYEPSLKHNFALILICFIVFFLVILGINVISPLVKIESQAYTFFHFMAFLFGISGFAIGILLKKADRTNNVFGNSQLVLIIISSALIPALHFAAVNPDYLSGIFYFLYILTIVFVSLLVYGIFRFSLSSNSSNLQIALSSGVFAFSVICLPLLRYMFRIRNDGDLDFWIMAGILLLGSFFVRSTNTLRLLTRVLLITLVVFCVSLLTSIISKAIGNPSSSKTLTNTMKQIDISEKPNIYLFVYDGLPNERVFRKQNLPFDNIRSLVDKYGFTLYDDTYTIGEMTLDSMGNMLDMNNKLISKVGKNSQQARDIYAGESYTNLILRKNGYKSHFLLDNYHVGINAFSKQVFYDELYPPRIKNSITLDYLIILLRGIFQGDMNFDTQGLELGGIDQYYMSQARKHELISDQKGPKFVVNHLFLPGHSQNSGVCRPNETELWASELSSALIQIEKDFAAVVENDPGAIVLAIGDHGPSLTGDCYRLAGWPRKKISVDMIWDRIGTMVAIRWPDKARAAKYDKMLVTNQDIFPVVFAYLMDDPLPLQLCPPDEFWGYKTPGRSAIGFDKGRFID